MKFSFICLLVLLAVAAVFARDESLLESTSTASTDAAIAVVSQQDVAISAAELQEFGVPPRMYTYNFRMCYYCKYSCVFQFPFGKQAANRSSCQDTCSKQDYCTEWVTPEYKRTPVLPFAVSWTPVIVPVDLALRLKLATQVLVPNTKQVIYKPAFVPWPWACKTPVEYVTPEYKPEPVHIALPSCYVTPDYATTSFSAPVRALKMYLTQKVIASLKLAPFTHHQVYYVGN